jgi:RNA polymerase primary sigma factor
MYQNGRNVVFIDRSNESVNMFLREARKYKPLTTEQEYDLWLQMRQGDKHAKDKLIRSNMLFVVTIAKNYVVSSTDLEDLLMAGALGITKAADAFDASLGFRFISFAKWHIEREIRNAAYDHLKHHSASTSLDQPKHDKEGRSYYMTDKLPSSAMVPPDWDIRYDDALQKMKRSLDNRYWHGVGDLLDDYLSMTEKGYTMNDFAKKNGLSDLELRRFQDMLRTEGRRNLKTAA